jgi:hypothetical protein
VAIIRGWRSWVKDENKMTIRDKIIGRDSNGRVHHHGAAMPLEGFTRDAAPVGSEVAGTGENSLAYREYNQTNRPISQGRIGNIGARRDDGAIRSVLCVWDADAETQIVEQDGLKYLLMWTSLQSGEGRPQSATTSDQITRSAVSGPEAATAQDAHRQMFDRIMDHNIKKPPAARRALAAIKRGTDTLESINAGNREFWGRK